MMKKYILVPILLLAMGAAFAQNKPKATVKQSVPELTRLIADTGFPYKKVNDSLMVIPFEGENIATYNVVVQKINDLYIVYTDLTEALSGKIDDTNSCCSRMIILIL